jgi:hypothetical protein
MLRRKARFYLSRIDGSSCCQRKSRASSVLDREGIAGWTSQIPADPFKLLDLPTASPHFLNVNSTGRHIRPSKIYRF